MNHIVESFLSVNGSVRNGSKQITTMCAKVPMYCVVTFLELAKGMICYKITNNKITNKIMICYLNVCRKLIQKT